jgi:hypothetical protein
VKRARAKSSKSAHRDSKRGPLSRAYIHDEVHVDPLVAEYIAREFRLELSSDLGGLETDSADRGKSLKALFDFSDAESLPYVPAVILAVELFEIARRIRSPELSDEMRSALYYRVRDAEMSLKAKAHRVPWVEIVRLIDSSRDRLHAFAATCKPGLDPEIVRAAWLELQSFSIVFRHRLSDSTVPPLDQNLVRAALDAWSERKKGRPSRGAKAMWPAMIELLRSAHALPESGGGGLEKMWRTEKKKSGPASP